MSGARKTPYQFGKRIGPDIPALVAKFPKQCKVHYKGRWYKFMMCSNPSCPLETGYWRAYSGNYHHYGALSSPNPTQTYCTEACAAENGRRLNAARQKRYWSRLSKAGRLRIKQRQRRYSKRRYALKYKTTRSKRT